MPVKIGQHEKMLSVHEIKLIAWRELSALGGWEERSDRLRPTISRLLAKRMHRIPTFQITAVMSGAYAALVFLSEDEVKDSPWDSYGGDYLETIYWLGRWHDYDARK